MNTVDGKTHSVSAEPSMDVRHIAEYMAASEQKKRTILTDCKYRPKMKLVQHQQARAVISRFLSGNGTIEGLYLRATEIESQLVEKEHDAKTNKYNAEYIRTFCDQYDGSLLPSGVFELNTHTHKFEIRGVEIRFTPQVLIKRSTKTNKLKCGSIMLRYRKGEALKKEEADFQSALAFDFLKRVHVDDGVDVDKNLCLTIDAANGLIYSAPGNSVYLFKEIRAACEGIAQRWKLIKPPKKAVI